VEGVYSQIVVFFFVVEKRKKKKKKKVVGKSVSACVFFFLLLSMNLLAVREGEALWIQPAFRCEGPRNPFRHELSFGARNWGRSHQQCA
jgi:hypothetical protein